MFIVTAKLSRRRAFLSAACIVLFLVVLFAALRGGSKKTESAPAVKAASNGERVVYLQSLGWELRPEPIETLTVPLPEELAEPYLSYNKLQREQGFDLSAYCGQTLSRYTYVVTNYPARESGCQADLYLCGDVIVGGDIVCTGEDGFMMGLAYPEKS